MSLEQHLKTICEVDAERGLHLPFVVDVDGHLWTVGSDGKSLFAIVGKLDGYELIADGLKGRLEGVTNHIRAARQAKDPIDLSSLRGFAGSPERDEVKDCGECGGTGSVCSCGECECVNCDNGKVIIDARARRGWINGRYCDLNRVAQLLAGVSGEVRILLSNGDESAISFAGDGWVAALAPLAVRPGDPSESAPRWRADEVPSL